MRERASSQAERDTQNLFAAAHMRDRVGDRFEGRISGLSNNGVFVTLDDPYVDGMIRIAQLNRETRDSFRLDDTGVRLVSERSKRSFTFGDRLVVEVEAASLARRQIDFVYIAKI